MSVDKKRGEVAGLDSSALQHLEPAKGPVCGCAKKLVAVHTESCAQLWCLADLFLVTVADSIKTTKI